MVGVVVLAAGLALGGCGATDGRRAAATSVATGFEEALRSGDAGAACAALAPATLRELEEGEKSPCPSVLGDQEILAGGDVTRVDVQGRQARVVLAGDTLFLSRFPGGWKVTAAGCRPRSDQPYDCAIKGG